MKLRLAGLLLVAALAGVACQEEEDKPAPQQSGGGGGGSKPSGGGGDVNLAAPRQASAPAPANPDLRARYERALQKMKDKDYDSAYVDLGAVVTQAPDSLEAQKAAKELEEVQNQLLRLPPTPPRRLLAAPKKFAEQPLSLRGLFRPPPDGGFPESFGLESEGGKVECRYERLHADAKKALNTLPSGTRLLVRGYWKAKAKPNFLDVSIFKIE